MKRDSLKAVILKFGVVAFLAICAYVLGTYSVIHYLDQRQAVDLEAAELTASAPKQAEQIVPGLLVPEEYGSISLQLDKLRKSEGLVSATFVRASEAGASQFLKCPRNEQGKTYVCAHYLRSQVITASDVGLPGSLMGYLVKHKSLANKRRDDPLKLALAALFAGIALGFLGLIVSILVFVERHVRQPLLNLNQSLVPVLDGRAGEQPPNFELLELRSLASQVEQLVRRYEEKKASAATGELAAQVAHDIRSPLAALDSIVSDISHLPEEKRLLVRSAVGRIRDIANDLMRLRRASADAAGEPPSARMLFSLVDSLLTEKRLQFRARLGIKIEGRFESAYGLFAEVQSIDFKRALSNLVDNSVEALGDKGNVTISMASREGQALITVRDDGKGIPPEVLSRLGERGVTHDKPGGSGLGLYHARTSVESWRGRLEIDSAPGQGTTVSIYLPKVPPPDWFVSKLILPSAGAVVILDDDTSIHQVWQGRLTAAAKDRGLEIVDVSTPQELRGWVAENSTKAARALYLLDYELVGYQETGLSLAAELAIARRTVLVTSRYDDPGILAECRRLEARMIPKSLAGLVPIEAPSGKTRWDAVLIDDDPLAQATWRMTASKLGKSFRAFSTAAEFLAAVEEIDRGTPVYVDAELAGGVKGSLESRRIRDKGFAEVYLATGHDPAAFADLEYLSGVVGKEPPWS